MALSDTVVVFDRGGIQQIGTPAELYRRPQSRFVAEFLGDSNLLDGALRRVDGRWVLEAKDGPVHLDGWTPPEGVTEGQHCLMFRPEDVLISDSADAVDDWKATVREVVYLGSEERVIVATQSGGTVTVRLSGDALRHRPEVGQIVALRFSARNAWLIRPDK